MTTSRDSRRQARLAHFGVSCCIETGLNANVIQIVLELSVSSSFREFACALSRRAFRAAETVESAMSRSDQLDGRPR